MQIQKINYTKFEGLPLSRIKATTKEKTAEYTLYKVFPKDCDFLNDVYNNIDLTKRMPGLAHNKYFIWNQVIKLGLCGSLGKANTTILIANKHKNPCGFLNFTEYDKKYQVNYVATWPVIPKVKEFMAGKVLFAELFNSFVKSNNTLIELEALRNAPFDPISKYMELGFRFCGGSNYQETPWLNLPIKMRINKDNVLKITEKLKKNIQRQEIPNPQEIDLYKKLNIVKN